MSLTERLLYHPYSSANLSIAAAGGLWEGGPTEESVLELCFRPIPGWTARASGYMAASAWRQGGGGSAVNMGKVVRGHFTCPNLRKTPKAKTC